MIAQGRRGSIVNIISTEGHQGNPGNVGYGTAKSGLLNFTRSVAMELAEYGIRVNSLTPSATDPTEGLARAAEWGVTWGLPAIEQRPDTTRGDQGVPLGHRPSPRHYARAAVFLASDDAEMITGTDLRVARGTNARYWRWNRRHGSVASSSPTLAARAGTRHPLAGDVCSSTTLPTACARWSNPRSHVTPPGDAPATWPSALPVGRRPVL